MSGNPINEIYHLVPVDKKSALAVSKGVSYVPEINIDIVESHAPLETKRLSSIQEDISGLTSGRLTAIAPYAKGKGRWVVRCVCGIYTIRAPKAMKKENPQNMCKTCMHKYYILRRNDYIKTGKDKNIEGYIR